MKLKPIAKCVLILLVGLPGLSAVAQNVTFDIAPLDPLAGDTVFVSPGERIPFEITATTSAIDPLAPLTPTNSGLVGFSANVRTDFGTLGDSFVELDSNISPLFPVNQSTGLPSTDDLLGIGGAQDLTGGLAPVPGVGVNNAQTIATGELVAPSTPGTFSVTLDGTADVLVPDESVSDAVTVQPAVTLPGRGFEVVVEDGETDAPDGQPTPNGDVNCAPMPAAMLAGMLIALAALKVPCFRASLRTSQTSDER